MSRMRKLLCRAALAAALTAAGLSPSLGQQPDPKMVEAAKKEGTVLAYGSIITPTWRAIKEGFEKKYPGITMEFVYLSGAPMLNRMMTEMDAGRFLADVFVLDVDRLPPLQAKGYLANYTSPEQVHYPKEWRSTPPGYWIQNHSYLAGVLYNRKQVAAADAPKSFEDLLDPKWSGKIAIVSPVANELLLYMFAGIIRDMGPERGWKYIENLAKQKPYVLGPGGLPVSQGVNTGQFPIGIGFLGHMYSIGGGEDGAMAIAATKPVYAVIGPGTGILKNAPHPNAARLLVDYIHSREVQKMIVALGYFSSYPGVDAPPSLARLEVRTAPLPTGAEAEAMRERLRKIFGL